jgi:cation transporter-like permease
MTHVATIVQTDVLWKLIVAALVAGIGITAVFALAIYGGTRFLDFRREGREAEAWAVGAVAAVALAAFAAAVAFGIVVMTSK